MTHVNIGKAHPAAYQALLDLNATVVAAATEAGLEARLVELVKIRVSQLNGCAFCLRMHSRDAIALGETADRLAVLAAWWESQYFTETERAALHLAEQVALVDERGRLPDRGVVVDEALSDVQVSAIAWLAIVMGSWNRVAMTSSYPVAP